MHRLMTATRAVLKGCLRTAQSQPSFANAQSVIVAIALLGIWLAAVIFTTTQHEFWRDEVRAWSLVRTASSPAHLFNLIRDEGHPALWYLLLYGSHSLLDTPLVLPIVSLVIAFTAVTAFLLLSPFPLWFRSLFIFCALPLYEYSVMARNYGVSMLLLFAAAALYRNRKKYCLLLASVLALLANANVHSAIFACLTGVVWACDTVIGRKAASTKEAGRSLWLGFAIIAAGLVLCAAVTTPGRSTVVTRVHSVSVTDLASSIIDAMLEPQRSFCDLLPVGLPPILGGLLLYLAVFGLLCRTNLFLAALGGLIGLGVLFRVVYPGGYRHQGLFLIFLLALYWIASESLPSQSNRLIMRRLFNVGRYAVLPIFILGNVLKDGIVYADIRMEMSSSRSFGAFLSQSAAYQDAIIVPEPDYLTESLPFYAGNPIYFAREHRFGTTVSWTSRADLGLSLGDLLSAARDLKTRYGRPVLLVLGHWEVGPYELRADEVGRIKFSYNQSFSWTAAELADANRSMAPLAEFKTALCDENYRVYALK